MAHSLPLVYRSCTNKGHFSKICSSKPVKGPKECKIKGASKKDYDGDLGGLFKNIAKSAAVKSWANVFHLQKELGDQHKSASEKECERKETKVGKC